MVIHFSLFAVILFCGLIWGRSEREWNLETRKTDENYISIATPYVIIFGYITFLAAMRTSINDTGVYRRSFIATRASLSAIWNEISNFNIKYSAFQIVSIVFKRFISTNYHWFFGFFALMESIMIVRVLRRESVSFFDSCYFIFAGGLWFNYMSMMRQWVAVVLVFFAVHAMAEKRTLKVILMIAFAGLFHPSAFLMIPVYFLVQGKPWSGKQMAIIGVFSVGMLFLNPILGSMGDALEGSTYDYVLDTMQTNSGSSWVRIFISAVPVVLSYMYQTEEENPVIDICTNMALITFLLNILATFTSGLYVIRFTSYTGIFELILYPYLLNVAMKDEPNRRTIKGLFYILYLALYIYSNLRTGSFYYGSDILGTFT